jgi:integrase/recombinase XerD
VAKNLPRILTESQVAALLRANPATKFPDRIKTRVVLEALLRTGLRANELCTLEVGHVHLDGENPHIEVRQGKGKRQRTVPITPVLLKWLKLWEDVRPDSRWYFCGVRPPYTGQQMAYRTLHLLVQRAGKRAGLTLSPHMLRHTYASNLLSRGLSTREIQELLGHASVGTTEIYTHVNPSRLAARVREAEALTPADPVREGNALVAQLRGLLAELQEQAAAGSG